MRDYLSQVFSGGDARLVIPKGAAGSAEHIRAVVLANGENINRELIDQGYGQFREDLGGPEARAMHGLVGKGIGQLAEGLAFQGDSAALNPMRYLPTPGHTKFWQERTPLAQYINNEVFPSCRTQNTSRARVRPEPLHIRLFHSCFGREHARLVSPSCRTPKRVP
jgi:hypothetical protein